MPNWCFNYLDISGTEEDLASIIKQLNQPFERTHDSWDMASGTMTKKLTIYSNPVFAFWNIIRPLDMEAYDGPQPKTDLNKPISFDSNHWYDWNVRNWGTKWDVAVHDEDKYPDTEMTKEEQLLSYRFNTAWSPPMQVIEKLSEQYPDCAFTLSFEEETGWGGEVVFEKGKSTEIESYDNKCRDCDALDTMDYCDNDCGEICNSCHWLGEADLECVAECDTHKVYLDDQHVPEYRKVQV